MKTKGKPLTSLKNLKGPSPHRIGVDGKPAKREWIVAEQEGRGGGVSYHFSGKAAAVRKFERVLANLEGGSVTAVELWDSRRVARVTVRVRYQKPTGLVQPHRNSDQ